MWLENRKAGEMSEASATQPGRELGFPFRNVGGSWRFEIAVANLSS